MIKVRAWYGEWREVDKEYALKFATVLVKNMSNVPVHKRIELFNLKHIKGAKFNGKEIIEE